MSVVTAKSSAVSTQGFDQAGSGDPIVVQLIAKILPEDEANKVLRGTYTKIFHSRLIEELERLRQAARWSASRKLHPLPKWRLKRVDDFILANIEERISLRDLAGVAGASPMHFAAQFREATGMRPHDYVGRRRLSLAADMLKDPARSIIDVALSVGFQTQSHFTTVFKRHFGRTPARWRQDERSMESSHVAA